MYGKSQIKYHNPSNILIFYNFIPLWKSMTLFLFFFFFFITAALLFIYPHSIQDFNTKKLTNKKKFKKFEKL